MPVAFEDLSPADQNKVIATAMAGKPRTAGNQSRARQLLINEPSYYKSAAARANVGGYSGGGAGGESQVANATIDYFNKSLGSEHDAPPGVGTKPNKETSNNPKQAKWADQRGAKGAYLDETQHSKSGVMSKTKATGKQPTDDNEEPNAGGVGSDYVASLGAGAGAAGGVLLADQYRRYRNRQQAEQDVYPENNPAGKRSAPIIPEEDSSLRVDRGVPVGEPYQPQGALVPVEANPTTQAIIAQQMMNDPSMAVGGGPTPEDIVDGEFSEVPMDARAASLPGSPQMPQLPAPPTNPAMMPPNAGGTPQIQAQEMINPVQRAQGGMSALQRQMAEQALRARMPNMHPSMLRGM